MLQLKRINALPLNQGMYDDSDCDSAELDHSCCADPSQAPSNWWKHDSSTHSYKYLLETLENHESWSVTLMVKETPVFSKNLTLKKKRKNKENPISCWDWTDHRDVRLIWNTCKAGRATAPSCVLSIATGPRSPLYTSATDASVNGANNCLLISPVSFHVDFPFLISIMKSVSFYNVSFGRRKKKKDWNSFRAFVIFDSLNYHFWRSHWCHSSHLIYK